MLRFLFFEGVQVNVTETDRFDVISMYYDLGNLTIITTHHVS